MAEQVEAPQGAEDGTLVRLGQAIMLHRGGDREEARNRFALLWKETEDTGHLFHRCAIAHYMADTQDDPVDELEWDRRALSAAEALSEERSRWREHVPAVRALYPSLHLNLAAGHARLGDVYAARDELARARGRAGVLADDVYGARVRSAIDRLETRLRDGAAPEVRRPGAAGEGGQLP